MSDPVKPFFTSNVSPTAKTLVAETLESGMLSEGSRVWEFERALEDVLGIRKNCMVAVNSGTAALHLALAAAGVGKGSEVIIPPQTFVATALAVRYCGATPVFCDVDKRTGLMDTQSALHKVTERTAAIMPVHWGGAVVDVGRLQSIYGEWVVIEDAAQALGAEGVGIGDLACFSFQATKHLTTGDGGAIYDNSNLKYKLRRLRWFGIDRESDLPNELGERQYLLQEVGYKYHMNNVAASIGLANLPDLPQTLLHHRMLARLYHDELMDTPWSVHPRETLDKYAWWFYPLSVERRDDFARAMRSRGVPVSVVHQRIDKHPIFGGVRTDLPGMDYFDAHQINLPVHTGIKVEDVLRYCSAILKGW